MRFVKSLLTEMPALATIDDPAINCKGLSVDINYPINTSDDPCATEVHPPSGSPTRAAGRLLIKTVDDPEEIDAV
jgi:hypothetical protein